MRAGVAAYASRPRQPNRDRRPRTLPHPGPSHAQAPRGSTRPSTYRPVYIPTPRACSPALVYGVGTGRVSCAAALSTCLAACVTDKPATCACYAAYSGCYKRAGG